MSVDRTAEIGLAPLDPARVSVLEWSQPERFPRRTWVLMADGTPVATLRWRGPWKAGYDARTVAGEWEIRGGFWGHHRLRRRGDDAPVVTSHWKGFLERELRREGDATLRWRSEGWTAATQVLENREKFPLLRIRRRRGFLRLSGRVELEDAGRSLPDLLPLVLLGWCMTIERARQHAH